MDLIKETEINAILRDAYNIYHYGSFVYGTFKDNVSDLDYIVIVSDDMDWVNALQYECENRQYTIYTAKEWQKMLDDCSVPAIESHFLPKKFVVKESVVFVPNISKSKIRNMFSKTASNSFVKCKKKLTVADSYDPKIAKKSLWHALRIIDFGTQIMKYGKIINYASMNHMYDEIINSDSVDWVYFKDKYQPVYNELKTKFRIAEKETEIL